LADGGVLMLRPAVHLTKEEYDVLIAELNDDRLEDADSEYDPIYRLADLVRPLRNKILAAMGAGERVIICPEKLGLAPSNGQARPAETPKLAGMSLDDAIRRVFAVTQCKAMTAPHVTSELIRQGWDGASRMQHATLLGRVRNALANQVQFTRVARGNYRPVAEERA
jgi:hypothetical protein